MAVAWSRPQTEGEPMAVQIRVKLDGETHRAVSHRWQDAIIQLGVYLGGFEAHHVPDFGQYANPMMEIQAWAIRVWPGAEIHCSRSQIHPTMQSAIRDLQKFEQGDVLVGGTPRDQELMWARLVEETSCHVTARDAAGRPSGSCGYMVRAEFADDQARDNRVFEMVAEYGMTLQPPGGYPESGLDWHECNNPQRSVEDWSL